MKMNLTPACDSCGKKKVISPLDPVPAMLGFVTKDGKQLNVCSACIEKVGLMTDEERDAFFKELESKTK